MDPAGVIGLGGMMAAHGGDMDALARARGFRDAAQMAAFYQQQQNRTGQNGVGGNVAAQQRIRQPAQPPIQPQPSNPFQALFGHIVDRWNAATGGR